MLYLFKQTYGKNLHQMLPCSALLTSYHILSDNLWLPGKMQYFVRANGIQTHISAVIYGSLDELLNVLNLIWFYIFMIPQVWILKCSLWLTAILQSFKCTLEPLILASFTVTYRSYISPPFCRIPCSQWYQNLPTKKPKRTIRNCANTFSTCSTPNHKDKDCLIRK